MKEFGLYTVKQSYIDEFSHIYKNLSEYKGTLRPFICVKLNGHNWLIPVTSLNPQANNYSARLKKYIDFYALEKDSPIKTFHFFRSITRLRTHPDYRDVVLFYGAIPVKHEHCNKYRDRSDSHIVLEKQHQSLVKGSLIKYLKASYKDNYIGFIGVRVREGRSNFATYPADWRALRAALYEKHNRIIKANEEKKRNAEAFARERARKRALRHECKLTQQCLQQAGHSRAAAKKDVALLMPWILAQEELAAATAAERPQSSGDVAQGKQPDTQDKQPDKQGKQPDVPERSPPGTGQPDGNRRNGRDGK
jgi:hypothetical protein